MEENKTSSKLKQIYTKNSIVKHSIKTFIILCLINPILSYSQSIDTFTLKGECEIQSGMVHLGTIESSYYPSNVDGYDTKLVNGKFVFNAAIKYPYAFRLFIMRNRNIVYVSDLFYVEKGLQTIMVNTSESGGMPMINNSTIKELKLNYTPWFESYNNNIIKYINKKDSVKMIYKNALPLKEDCELTNELKALSNKNDSLLLLYTKKYPDSYVALWKLVDKVTNGYKDIYDSIAISFSKKIKKTYTGRVLEEKLKTARVVKIGNVFPTLILSDSKQNINLKAVHSKNKYTLIDFWFSDCSPCKVQFQELKKLYENYSTKGFNIIGISVDQKDNLEKWKKTINSYSLTWEQYLDFDSKETQKLSIMAYPSNFLLDENGIIIDKDIILTDLFKFLEKNLK